MTRSILYVCNDGFYFAQHRAHVALRMLDDGWTVRVATGGDTAAIPPRLDVSNLPVNRLRLAPAGDLRLALAIRRTIVEFRPDVVHFITMKPIVFGAVACLFPPLPGDLRPRRFVATFPGLGRAFEGTSLGSQLQRKILEIVLRLLFRRLPIVATFENSANLERLKTLRIVRSDQARLISGAGVALEQFAATNRHPNKRFRALWASRFIRGKGLRVFVEAARRASAAGLEIDFLVAGYADPEHADRIEAKEIEGIVSDPAISFLDHVLEIEQLLGQVDAVVLPSSYEEGLPRILIEAAAAGLPSVSSDTPGCRSIVVHGETGLLLEEISAGAVLDAVSRLAADRDLASRMGRNARDLVDRHGFDAAVVQDAFIDCYMVP